MQQNKIIVFISVLFILCAGYLFWVSDQGLKSDAGKDWWALYFENSESDSLNFTIENHSAENAFHWTVSANNQKVSEGEVEVKPGESKNISGPAFAEAMAGKKISITVSSGKDKKEIYKNFVK